MRTSPWELVEAMEHCANRRPLAERLVSAWDQWSVTVADHKDDPQRHSGLDRAKETDSNTADGRGSGRYATARAQGISVTTLARQHGMHHGRSGQRPAVPPD